MKYDITLIVINKDEISPEREKLTIHSETALTCVQAKSQAFAACKFDSAKYEKESDELWTKMSIVKPAALEDAVNLSEKIHSRLEYYLTLKKK
jgi:hypothetical protein